MADISLLLEFDLLDWARDIVKQQINAFGEEAFEIALAEKGYVQDRLTCEIKYDSIGCFWYCSVCDAPISPSFNYCACCGSKVVKHD